ncbi:hypothetical protein C4A37_03649 [Escherichia coli]|nr:hypothetical protein C4A72_03626 [Escherichia coli]RDO88124.1 hypothetical protein C4A65_03903 [Escherichia coli]RDO95157.1 hypothetical protein C4A63_03926 [Escherichia coli]RDQ11695.1 hypothetical protein C4A37_03649 [Escherichia coli]
MSIPEKKQKPLKYWMKLLAHIKHFKYLILTLSHNAELELEEMKIFLVLVGLRIFLMRHVL